MDAFKTLPLYQCNKQVRAARIVSVGAPSLAGYRMYPIVVERPDGGTIEVSVPEDFILKHAPADGGYLVCYADGYLSFSPAKAFEDGYTQIVEDGHGT